LDQSVIVEDQSVIFRINRLYLGSIGYSSSCNTMILLGFSPPYKINKALLSTTTKEKLGLWINHFAFFNKKI